MRQANRQTSLAGECRHFTRGGYYPGGKIECGQGVEGRAISTRLVVKGKISQVVYDTGAERYKIKADPYPYPPRYDTSH
jgi:hypothetical protein